MIRLALLGLGLMVLAGCASPASPNVRPYPAGNPAAASKPLDTGVPVLPRTVRVSVVPAHLFIPAIGVNTTLLSLGTESAPDPFLGGQDVTSFEVPPDLARAGWWRDGPRVGAGMAVILGHTQVGGGRAVFNRLAELKAGDQLLVDDATGRTRVRFTVAEVVGAVSKSDPDALQIALATRAKGMDLAMITCSGGFDTTVSESQDNTVVFARRS